MILILALLPILNYFLVRFVRRMALLAAVVNKITPFIYAAILIGLKNNEITLLKSYDISLSLAIDSFSFKCLILLNFLWIIFVFYTQKFLQFSEKKLLNSVAIDSILVIAVLNLIILSKNLQSLALSFFLLLCLNYLLLEKYFSKNLVKQKKISGTIFYLQALLFFVANLMSKKFFGQDELISNINEFDVKLLIIFVFYFFACFLSLLLPIMIFSESISMISSYVVVLLAQFLGSFFVFLKIINSFFNQEFFGFIVSHFYLVELPFLGVISTASALLAFRKSNLFYTLIIQQFFVCLFATIFIASFAHQYFYVPTLSTILTLTLLFFCFSNLLLYQNSCRGAFYDLKVTAIFLCLSFLNLLGLSFMIGSFEAFLLVKNLVKHDLWFSSLILLINFFALIIFFARHFYSIFIKIEPSEEKWQLAKKIDFDSSLILTATLVALALLVSPIIILFFVI